MARDVGKAGDLMPARPGIGIGEIRARARGIRPPTANEDENGGNGNGNGNGNGWEPEPGRPELFEVTVTTEPRAGTPGSWDLVVTGNMTMRDTEGNDHVLYMVTETAGGYPVPNPHRDSTWPGGSIADMMAGATWFPETTSPGDRLFNPPRSQDWQDANMAETVNGLVPFQEFLEGCREAGLDVDMLIEMTKSWRGLS
jgi:hypothetical protein